jgi:hypothetical protein
MRGVEHQMSIGVNWLQRSKETKEPAEKGLIDDGRALRRLS